MRIFDRQMQLIMIADLGYIYSNDKSRLTLVQDYYYYYYYLFVKGIQ